MNLADFSTSEIAFARHLWAWRDGRLYISRDPVEPSWERLKPEVQLEFCLYARCIVGRELRTVAAKRYSEVQA